MRKYYHKIPYFLTSIFLIICLFISPQIYTFNFQENNYIDDLGENFNNGVNIYPNLAQVAGNFSRYNLSVSIDEASSTFEGNLTVNFYNNDNVNLSRIPFHIYLSGMDSETRPGFIEILNVTDLDNPNIAIPFNVYSNQQIMWVNLTDHLEYQKRAEFIIQFNATIPDGPIDRANSHGTDVNQSRIYKYGSFYPIPCVYDSKDGWNIDPYLTTGDPFYFDMAYYNFFIEAPNGMIVAATGALENKTIKGSTTLYQFNPIYPVREVTFSASRYFQIESKIVNGVNLSTYFLPKSSTFWATYALNYAENALILFNHTFGLYPYPTLNIVEEYTAYGGMEYPNQVYITEAVDNWNRPISENRRFVEEVIVHEVCHQWWYNLVGNDEVDVGFLDEGMTCWSTDYYGEIFYGDWEYFQNIPYIYSVRTYFAETGLSSKINQTVYECFLTNTDYYYVAYQKAPLIFEIFRQQIGLTNFIAGLKHYVTTHQFEHVLLSDLQDSFEFIVGSSLDWFFNPWFDNEYLPNYSFSDHSYNPDTKRLTFTIEDLNEPWNDYEYSQQVPVAIYDSTNQIILSENLWINGTTEISFNLPSDPSIVSLIYVDYVLVQLNSNSNFWLDLHIEQAIPGYDLYILILVSLQIIGISIIIIRKKLKRLY